MMNQPSKQPTPSSNPKDPKAPDANAPANKEKESEKEKPAVESAQASVKVGTKHD